MKSTTGRFTVLVKINLVEFGLVLDLSQFSLLLQLIQKMTTVSKVVKSGSNNIILVC